MTAPPQPQERPDGPEAADSGEPAAPGPTSHAQSTLTAVQNEMAEVFGEIAEFWGFTKTQGRIFGLTYMSPLALDQSAIRARLKISAGGASQTLASLVDWGVLHQDGRSYVAETNFFALITRVLQTREKGQVEHAIVRVKEAVAALRQVDGSSAHSDAGDAERHADHLRFAIERLEHLLGFFELGRDFLLALVERNPVRALLNGLARRAQRIRPRRGAPKVARGGTSGSPREEGDSHAPV